MKLKFRVMHIALKSSDLALRPSTAPSVLFDPKLSYSTTFLSLSSLAVKVVIIPFIL